MTILVTGGCGFIGSNFIRRWLAMNDEKVINLDALTYAGNLLNTKEFENDPRYELYLGDINSFVAVRSILDDYEPRAIINFAAETHVDNSISNSLPFLRSNINGTVNLLECVRQINPSIKFIHVSTDEVYGSLNVYDSPSTEHTAYAPRSPYSASKAASDHFVNAYRATYGLNTIITNCSNNYGPFQHPEKFIPTILRKALTNSQIPVYGTGRNIRDWIYVYDHCDALVEILERGRIGEKYNIGGNMQMNNLDLAKKILDILNMPHSLISFVEDRKGHDFRYDIDNTKIYTDIGWQPRTKFDVGLTRTIEWYKQNMGWIISCLQRSASY